MALNPQKILNALRKIDGIELFDSGGGHGQGWKITSTGSTGSIPLTAHGIRNLPAAIRELNKALKEAGIDRDF